MDRVRTLGETAKRFDGGVRYLGQGRAAEGAAPVKQSKVWYNTSRWRKLRASVLLRDEYRCRYCGQVFSDTAKLVADHVQPHRESPRLFWEEENLQCLCATCHSKVKQSEEAGGG